MVDLKTFLSLAVPYPEKVGHTYVSTYICIQNITKPPAKFKQVLDFEFSMFGQSIPFNPDIPST